MNEIEINARFTALTNQRNNALNTSVLLEAELVVAQAMVRDQEATIVDLRNRLELLDAIEVGAAATQAETEQAAEEVSNACPHNGVPCNA